MKRILRARHIVSDMDLSESEIRKVFDVAKRLKRMREQNASHRLLDGRSLAVVVGEERRIPSGILAGIHAGMTELGGHAFVVVESAEAAADSARMLSRTTHGIMTFGLPHQSVLACADQSGVPVLNGLSDAYDPCQALSALFTMHERLGSLQLRSLCFVGDGGSPLGQSLLLSCVKAGVNIVIASPSDVGHAPDAVLLAKREGKKTKASITFVKLADDLGLRSDAIVMDPGQTDTGVAASGRNVIHGMEERVVDPQENYLHVLKALLSLILKA